MMDSLAKNIIGTWELKEFSLVSKDQKSKLWDWKPNGLLIYTEYQRMSVSINKEGFEIWMILQIF